MRKIDINNEREYENLKVDDSSIRSSEDKFYHAIKHINKKHDQNTYQVIKDKIVLEVGCSQGIMAKLYSKNCKSFIGCDISNKAIEVAENLNLPNCKFICCDAHVLPFDDDSFEIVIVNSLLHHLDLEVGLKEISRVLKSQGKLIIREPLGINPIFNLYRNATPESRTVDEQPFRLKELRLIRKYFVLNDVEYYGFLNLICAYIPNKSLSNCLSFIDHILSFSPIKYLFWHISGELTLRKT